MKKIFLLVGIVCFIISLFFTKRIIDGNESKSCGRVNCHGGICPYVGNAFEGTYENPFARKQYEWTKYRNPLTTQIPANIRVKENEFVNSMRSLHKSSNIRNAYQWEYRGPFGLGGRTRAIALDYDNEQIIHAGGISGGMWKTTNAGLTWIKTTAPNQLHNVTCVVQNKAAGRKNIWYYGTGEGVAGAVNSAVNFPQFYQEFLGDGIFKSTDGGNSWSVLQSTVSGSVNTKDNFDFIIELETFGNDGLMAATSNGVFVSTNGGSNWQHALNFGEAYNSSNIEITDNGTFYASIAGDGTQNGIYKSLDGINWQKISNSNFPTSVYKTVIALAPSNQNTLYSLSSLKNDQGTVQLLKYDGSNWSDITSGFYGGQVATYAGAMQVLKIKPDDPNTIFIGTVGFSRSTNGGQSYEIIGGHNRGYVDQQSIVFLRSNPNKMIIGNDGGIWKTENNMAPSTTDNNGYVGIDWISLTNNLRSSQFYTVAIDHATPLSNTIVGGLQDRGQYITRTNNSVSEWEQIGGGDGGFCAITDGGQYIYYSLAAMHQIMRYPNEPNTWNYTSVTPENSRMGLWMSPMILDPHDSKVMYLLAADDNWNQKLWRNTDLTQIPAVFPPTPTSINWSSLTNAIIPNGSSISAFGMSSASPRRLYYSCNGQIGEFFRLDNPHQGQPVAVRLTFPSQVPAAYLHCICVDPYDVNKITVCLTNYGIISIYHSADGGNNWTAVSGNLEENPDGSGNGPSIRWISVLYVQGQPIYFAATSAGLFSTTYLNGMNTRWVQEGAAIIGNVPVDMIDVRQSDGWVVAATCGNGVYSTYVTEIQTDVKEGNSIPTGYSLSQSYPNPFNPSTTIEYSLPKAGFVTLKVYDIHGVEVANLVNEYKQAGTHLSTLSTFDFPLSSGVYFYQLKSGNFVVTKKLILQK